MMPMFQRNADVLELRRYMGGRSERDFGVVLKQHARDSFILQTKVAPLADPEEFRAKLEASFERLQIEKIDLFAFHGLNNAEQLAMVLQGGCLEIAQGRWGWLVVQPKRRG